MRRTAILLVQDKRSKQRIVEIMPLLSWGSIEQAPFHVLDMSWTVLLMLRWYDELERDSRLLAYAAAAALKAMTAVLEEIVPCGRWEDFEAYWSCSSYGRDDLIGRKIARNNMYKQCNFSMFWTAEALFQCFQATDDRMYLLSGQRCLDEMLMSQASWQPPYLPVEALGGFGVMNADGEWNDARQSLFAELIINYGLELDKPEYIERGIAALRASFVMIGRTRHRHVYDL